MPITVIIKVMPPLDSLDSYEATSNEVIETAEILIPKTYTKKLTKTLMGLFIQNSQGISFKNEAIDDLPSLQDCSITGKLKQIRTVTQAVHLHDRTLKSRQLFPHGYSNTLKVEHQLDKPQWP